MPSELEKMVELAKASGALVWFEPTSAAKCRKALPLLQQIDFLSPNAAELRELVPDAQSNDDAVRQLLKLGAACVIATLGSNGVLLGHKGRCTHIAVPRLRNIANVTGAGDNFAAGVIAALIQKRAVVDAVQAGIAQAQKHLIDAKL